MKKKKKLFGEEEKNIIEQYIEKIEGNEYEKQFPEKVTEKEIYYLSSSSQNILNWYPFKKEDTILEVGGDLGQLTQIYTENCKEAVTIEPNLIKAKAISKRYETADNLEIIVGNLKNIKIDKKFDYIIFIGNIGKIPSIMGQDMKLQEVIKTLEQYLSENGKFLIAVDNKFGLKYFLRRYRKCFKQKIYKFKWI